MVAQFGVSDFQRGNGPIVTYEEFRDYVSGDRRAEWVQGELIELMPPTKRHQDVLLFLAALLQMFVRKHALGEIVIAPFEMRIRDGLSYREPDLLFVAKSHLGRFSNQRLEGPADLVVEIVSPESAFRDTKIKRWEYAAAGIPEYWTIDPRPEQPSFDVFQLSDDGHYTPIPAQQDGKIASVVLQGLLVDANWFSDLELPDPLLIHTRD